MTFAGFSPEALDFLARLPERDPAWFKANKKDYTRLIANPAKAFVADLGAALQALRPNFVAQPKTNGSIAPINNDLRFSPDRPPYKDHLLFKVWEGATKKTAPTLYVRLTATDVGFAAGIVPADVGQWRETVDSPLGARLAAAIDALQEAKDADVVGQALKRVPAPYDAEHPRGGLLRHKMLQLRWPEPSPSAVHGPEFVDWCTERLSDCIPLHALLVEAFP